MDNIRAHVYIDDINAFNIIFPDKADINWTYPCSSWLFGLKIEGQRWQKFLAVVLMVMPLFTITMAIDAAKALTVDLASYLFKEWFVDGVKHLFRTVLDSVVKKLLGVLAIAVAIFLIYFFIKSGLWAKAYEFVLSLCQSQQ